MDEDAPHQMRWPRVAARVVGYPLLAVVVYVLGLSPVVYVLAFRSPMLDRALEGFYKPITWLAERTALEGPFLNYDLWWYYLPHGPNERLLRKSPPLPASQVPTPAERIPAPERAP